MNVTLKKLKEESSNISLLYVEDNDGLRKNMSELFGRMLDNVAVATDGEEGYTAFLKSSPQIIVTDLNMPKVNGFEMIKKIKALEPNCKIIILTAHDEKKQLYRAIELGVFRYIHKPAKVTELLKVIREAVFAIQKDENRELFTTQLQTIVNYQNNIVVMMEGEKFILSNKRFLEFFAVDDLESFYDKYQDVSQLLLEHDEFLSSSSSQSWMTMISKNINKLFHTKLKGSDNKMHHLILKAREVPSKKNTYVLSFDDVTELNLMSLFDTKLLQNNEPKDDKKAIIHFMNIVKDNASKVKIHNFYRGLTIVNSATIINITEDEVTFKTGFTELKIVDITKFMVISSEIFPQSVISKSIKKIDFDENTITIDEMNFSVKSSTDRKYARLEPEDEHSCEFFYKNIKFFGEVKIADISEVSVKLELNALPAGIKADNIVKVAMNLHVESKILSIMTEASVLRIEENTNSFYIVLLFTLNEKELTEIKKYLVYRQMALIREFKTIGI